MRNMADLYECIVISTWKCVEERQRWFAIKEWAATEGKIDTVLGASTEYKVSSYN